METLAPQKMEGRLAPILLLVQLSSSDVLMILILWDPSLGSVRKMQPGVAHNLSARHSMVSVKNIVHIARHNGGYSKIISVSISLMYLSDSVQLYSRTCTVMREVY